MRYWDGVCGIGIVLELGVSGRVAGELQSERGMTNYTSSHHDSHDSLVTAADYGDAASFHAREPWDQHERRNEAAYTWARAAAHVAFVARPDLRNL